ncbi:MAG: S-methyl-5-thioribose-1-phosphate isomerase, partial [Dehalococcoidia bacterium]|nr:S-methyl-5-thioribose-1-phosphate isomerase [Dehalococcoidia bacterium]
VDAIAGALAATRPTAVNLFQALERMQATARSARDKGTVEDLKATLVAEAQRIDEENLDADCRIGELGAELIEAGTTVLTHCNAGALATAGCGTALGVIRAAHIGGRNIQVLATETRPLLQGARLTAYELMREGIPVTLITDSMAGFFLHRGEVSAVIVGADRIAANGDVANKIGTYTLSVLAAEHGVPFYVAAPTTTVDMKLASGDEIPIEERGPEEVTHIKGVAVAPEGVKVANPAFDVTPHMYVTALITERGVLREPFHDRIRKILIRED